MVNWVSRGTGVLDGGGDHRRGKSWFRGKFETSHCNQWGICCVVVRECSVRAVVGEVSGVGHGMGVVDGVQVPQAEGAVLGDWRPHSPH